MEVVDQGLRKRQALAALRLPAQNIVGPARAPHTRSRDLDDVAFPMAVAKTDVHPILRFPWNLALLRMNVNLILVR